MPDEEKFCFFGTGRTNDLPSEAILFIISQSKEYPRLDCMAQDYVILGFSADKWNVYKAELEHDFSADKDKLEMYNNMEAKYLKYLEPYDICVCDNPRQSYDGTLSENTITDGLTHLSKGNGVCERLLFLRANKEGLSQAVYHELGHIIDFNDFNSDSFMSDSQTVVDSMEAEMPALKEKYHISDQNTSTRMEYFAEAFRLSFSDPDGLRETAPHIASYMENMKAQI